jgi:hypothetical protein
MRKRILKKMGFLADSRGIISRLIHVEGAWDSHLHHTREFILDMLTGEKVRKLFVYGSGWLLDFPLEEASRLVDRIWLFDVRHPPQVIHRIRKFPNVTPIVADITGGAIERTFKLVGQYHKSKIKPDPDQVFGPDYVPPFIPDFAVSLNILSQIGSLIVEYLGKNIAYKEEELNYIEGKLQEQHMRLLMLSKSILITDVEETRLTMENDHPEVKPVLHIRLQVSSNTKSWEWRFDPTGDFEPNKKILLKVIGIKLPFQT